MSSVPVQPLPEPGRQDAVAAGATATDSPAGVIDELSGAFDSARTAFLGLLSLIAMEARRAGLALAWMLALAVAVALLAVSTWLGVLAAFVIGGVTLGLHPIAAIAIVTVVNLLGCVVLVGMCIRASRSLLFAATRRQLAGEAVPAAARP